MQISSQHFNQLKFNIAFSSAHEQGIRNEHMWDVDIPYLHVFSYTQLYVNIISMKWSVSGDSYCVGLLQPTCPVYRHEDPRNSCHQISQSESSV